MTINPRRRMRSMMPNTSHARHDGAVKNQRGIVSTCLDSIAALASLVRARDEAECERRGGCSHVCAAETFHPSRPADDAFVIADLANLEQDRSVGSEVLLPGVVRHVAAE